MQATLNGSTVAIPVDLQFVNLADTEPVPIKNVKPIRRVKYAPITIAAAGQFAVDVLDASDFTKYTVGVVASAAHNFKVAAQRRDDVDDIVFDASTAARETIMDVAALTSALSEIKDVKSTRFKIFITNNDTASRDYTVYLYKLT